MTRLTRLVCFIIVLLLFVFNAFVFTEVNLAKSLTERKAF